MMKNKKKSHIQKHVNKKRSEILPLRENLSCYLALVPVSKTQTNTHTFVDYGQKKSLM